MAKVRASLAGVTVSCGVISFDVDLVPATKAKVDKDAANSTTLKRVCPKCADPTRMKQWLMCENGHGPISQSELDYAVEVDGDLHKVDEAEMEALKDPVVEAKTVAFSIFPADQVEATTLPSGNVYRLRLPAKPSAATVSAYALLLDLVADASLAFLAELVVKGVSKLYRGVARDGMITLTELYRPSLFHPADGADVACDARLVEAGRAMIAGMVADFDPAGWESAAESRLQALREAAAKNEPIVEFVAPPQSVSADEVLELLRLAAA